MEITIRTCCLILLAGTVQRTAAIHLDVNDSSSIRNAASTVANGLMKYYTGNITNTPGTIAVLPPPYYWWEAGAMWGALVDYWHYTNDPSYIDVTHQALVSQVGPLFDYMVPNHQKDEGNDDQAFWGFATMSAAEKNFPAPPSGTPGWLELTINLWNTIAARWDTTSCNGGLKWQIFPFNNGYDYKNSVSNGAFFQLSARLAHFTGNTSYLDWANKSWDWSKSIGLIDDQFNIYDGTDDKKNCTEINHLQFSYSLGIYIYGAAVMYNMSGSQEWADRTSGLLKASSLFFSPYPNSTDVMFEQACETISTCNNDQWSFKAYLSRFMWATTRMAPFTAGTVKLLLRASAQAAAGACSGGADGTTCGAKWYVGGWDGGSGPGQQLSALETIQGLLASASRVPLASGTLKLAVTSTAPVSTSLAPLAPLAPAATSTSRSQKRARVGIVAVGAAVLANSM